ncbi:diguanylate cyclase [Rhizobium sp. 0TCS1.26]|uniref:diguanylate cyclase domain-containing protein n=1 Tax=Rhizobium sp. 0TCS1.26 TaxID=3142623 RepID=UPI003D288F6D
MTDTTAAHSAGPVEAATLDQLLRQLIRIATAADIDSDASLAIQSLDARQLLDQFPQSLLLKDRRGRYVFANAPALAAAGLASEEELFGRTVFDLDMMESEVAEQRFLLEQQLMADGVAFEQEETFGRGAEGSLWYLTTRTPMRNEEGQVVGLIVMARDITERKRQEDLNRGQATVLEMVARGRPLKAILTALCGLVQQQLQGVTASVLLFDPDINQLRHGASPDLPDAFSRLVDGIEIGPQAGSCGAAAWRRQTIVTTDIDSDPLWDGCRKIAAMFGLRSCWSTPIIAVGEEVLGTLALYSKTVRAPTPREAEISAMAADLAGIAIERARNEQRIHHMAHHDPLTGLPNRALFWPKFGRALSDARREGRKIIVAYIDLDNFKQINDTLGHAIGDEVLRTIANRMLNSVRPSDLVVRLGGDEFAIVFSHINQDRPAVVRRLQHVRASISAPVSVDDAEISATCSMGVAFYPGDGDTPEALLASADRAMYDAKRGGRDALRLSATG